MVQPQTQVNDDDIKKLQAAFQQIVKQFESVDAILQAFGLKNMPVAHRYGIMFGCIVFTLTVASVIALLVLGGSFERIKEQEQTGKPTLLTSSEKRKDRALLLERLLTSRERLAQNYQPVARKSELTSLTKMLLNVAPDPVKLELVDDESQQKKRYIPPHYEENYLSAYRKCQDRPGGSVLAGKPEARFEAYARAFAGCGPYTALPYRRSYARLYESNACESQQSDDKYVKHFETRPADIMGRFVRLEALEIDRHALPFHEMTSGKATLGKKSYDPNQIWGFQPEGPFANVDEMKKSFVFCHKPNQAGFGVIDTESDKLAGVILLTNDDPENLTIQLEMPILLPESDGSQVQLECCFLLMDRLFAYGYRRIQIASDTQHGESRKWAVRLGFTLEGTLFKHLIVKDANRDTAMYGLLNADWRKGARSALFRKLYGDAAWKKDRTYEKKEAEFDEQQRKKQT